MYIDLCVYLFKGRGDKKGPETYIDPAMIGVLIGMALMFIIICVVLRLFSQYVSINIYKYTYLHVLNTFNSSNMQWFFRARWRENRTIFNTPNPRLMNVSLLRESKLLHGQERRGSRMSVRVPSRQPSMASLRPHSPNPSLGKTGSYFCTFIALKFILFFFPPLNKLFSLFKHILTDTNNLLNKNSC